MILNKLLNTYTLTLFAVTLIYFFYVSVFIKPWRFEDFSMVDDGQVLLQSSSYLRSCFTEFKCTLFIDQTFEFGSSRFRPTYWLINNINFELFGLNPVNYHLFRTYVLGYSIILLLSIILLRQGVAWSIVITVSSLFMSTPSFAENIVRLGTNEPYQILFIALFSMIYLKSRNIKHLVSSNFIPILLLLIWILLIKENNVVLIATIVLTEFVLNKFKFKFLDTKSFILLIIPFAIFAIGVFFTRYIPSLISLDIPEYTSNYVTSPIMIFNNFASIVSIFSNSMSPFLKLSVLLLPVLYMIKKTRQLLLTKEFVYWTLLTVLSIGILLPWRHVLDRYHLIGIFSASVVVAMIFNETLKHFIIITRNILPNLKSRTLFFEMLLVFILLNLFFKGLPVNLARSINYANWFGTFTMFEGDQMRAISKYDDSDVSINALNNINNWEYLYEIPIHQKYIYERDFKIHLLEGDQATSRYVVSRFPSDSYIKVDMNDNNNIKDSKKYMVTQIDPIKFRSDFKMKPIATTLNPPILDEKIIYYWEIRESR